MQLAPHRYESLFGRFTRIEVAWVAKAIIAGLVGATAMIGVLMGLAYAEHVGVWGPVRAIADEFFGVAYGGMRFEARPVLLALLVHGALSSLYGVMFALAVGVSGRPLPLAVQFVAGIALGALLWALRLFVFAGLFRGTEVFTSVMPAASWLFGFLAYGVVTAYIYDRLRHEETALT